MRIFGLDVTSRPRARKPITCAVCDLDSGELRLETVESLTSFESLEEFLQRPGPWVAGLDFPFGQPRKLVEDLGWPLDWEGYVERVSRMTRQEFALTLRTYWTGRPIGEKFHFRSADKIARACSPMMLDFTPVGKMFYELAPRLMRSGGCVIPCRPNASDRVAVEAYPGVLARHWIDRLSYKSESRKKQTSERLSAREELLARVESPEFGAYYGFKCSCRALKQMLVQDATGDTLDAFLCAVQAAWAHTHRHKDYGMPENCDALEGCIADPQCFSPNCCLNRPNP